MSPRSMVLILAAVLALPGFAGTADAASVFTEKVPGHDGHLVPVTVYLADVTPAPTLLWGHGWAGSRADSASTGAFFAANGYNVVAMDFRGHGDARSTSQARVHDVDVEIKDVQAVITWIAGQPWAALEGAGDPTLGALGGSYGGGYQLLTAAFDDRLDAIAPEITWSHLPTSLAPNGGIKSAWVDLLYYGGTARANLDPLIHQGYWWAMTMNEFPDGELPGEPNIVSLFEKNSPASYAGAIDVPTFLIQGMPDTLFNYNQALANYADIRATGAPVKLMTHLGGHIVNTRGTVPGGLPDTGLQAPAAPSPCGNINERILAWYDHTLKGAEDTVPDFAMALDDGTCITPGAGAIFPARTTVQLPSDYVVPQGVPVASATPRVAGNALDVGGLRIPLVTATEERVLAGVPQVQLTYVHAGQGRATAYFSLVVVGADGHARVLDDQVTPLRLDGGPASVGYSWGLRTFDLGGVGARLQPGDVLHLQVSSFDAQFGQNAERAAGALQLQAVEVRLPLLD